MASTSRNVLEVEAGQKEKIVEKSSNSTKPKIFLDTIAAGRDVIVRYLTLAEETSPPVFPLHDPFFENIPVFVGREKLISQVQSQLSINQQIILIGMPGVGKTQVAIEYAHRCKNTYKVVWYLQAQSKSHLRASYLSLALALKAEGINENSIIDSAKQKLQQLNDSYLLVFDNVKNPDDIKPYLPIDGKGHIFITTPLGDETKWNGKVLKLDLFTEDECLELFCKLWGKEIIESEKQTVLVLLNQLLGRLPLGISQATKFMSSHNLTIVEFVEKFQTHLIEFLLQEGLENHSKSIFTAFNNVLEVPEITFALKAFLIEEGKEFNQALLQKPSLGLLKSRAYLIHYGLVHNQSYVPHPLFAAIIKNRALLEAKSKSQKTDDTVYETIASEYIVPTLARILKSSAAPISSSKLLNKNGENFYVQEYKWGIQQLDFYFGDDARAKIFLENIKTGNDKIVCYQQLVPLSEPKFPIKKFLLDRNLSFKHWGNYIEQIQVQLKKERVVILTGMAGVGKTQFATQFAYGSEESYELVWPILTHSKESLEVSYLLLAATLNVIAAEDETLTDVIRKTKEKLENLNKPFLLIFDNAISQEILKPYLPNTKFGHIVITSRISSDWSFQKLELKLPTQEQAFELFLKLLLDSSNGKRQIREDEVEHAKYLVEKLLGCLPLAIAQAAKHIAKTNITIQQYISYFTTDLTKLWQHEEQVKGYFGMLKTAWDYDYDKLSDTTKQLLQYLSCLSHAEVDTNTLKQLMNNQNDSQQTLSQLISNYLIEKTELGFKVHSLQQLSIREKLFQEPELLLARLKYLVLILQVDTEKYITHLNAIKTIAERLSNHWLQRSPEQSLQLKNLLSDTEQLIQIQLPTFKK